MDARTDYTDASPEVQVAVDRARAADLGVLLADEPDPVFLGSPLIYTVTVTNNGPSAASGVSAPRP